MTIRDHAARRRLLTAMLLTTTTLVSASAAYAAADEVIVTAEKRTENVQNVPMSVEVLTTQKLSQLQVENFNDYVKFLPSVTFQGSTLAGSAGFGNVYMRGVASGNDGNHSGSLPSVGVYLDEAPITTIGGALDLHIYDVARVESLAGPQGTLYGASSQAGTVRIITNKPQNGVFAASYDVELNQVDHGGTGYVAEGMINVPIGKKAAIRLVGWGEHDAGYIDNVAGTFPAAGIIDGVRTFPTSGAIETVKPQKNYNTVDTYGARAALKIDLNENWTLTPSAMLQSEKSHGLFAYDPHIGDLKVSHFFPEYNDDRWYQTALTLEGKISNFDIVYAGSFASRHIKSEQDYTDYSFFYDQIYGYGAYVTDDAGNPIDPSQYILGRDHFTKQSHELRISSPADKRLRVVAGLFYERQTHFIEQRYVTNGLATSLSVTGWPDTIWLTEQKRLDKDYAAFGEASFDIMPKLTLTAGVRVFRADNSLKGFFGFSANFSSHTGESQCFGPPTVGAGPCTDLNKAISETGETHKVNLTYHIDDQKMVYFTYSTGFRPGGINRRSTIPPYLADTLTNYEVGFKTSWLDSRLRLNGAAFLENWDNAQFSVLGLNSFTEIHNVGSAEIKGFEFDASFRPDDHWTFTANGTYLDSQITTDYCGLNDPATHITATQCPGPIDPNPPEAPKGTPLPVTPKFKGSAVARYEWDWMGTRAHLQAAGTYQGSAWADLRVGAPDPITCVLNPVIPSCPFLPVRGALGKQRAFATLDLTAGIQKDNWFLEASLTNATDTRGDAYRYSECTPQVCGAQPYIGVNRPRMIAIKFGQNF
jgi:outer membrane receptor protein involved in Fe transport